MPVPPELFMSPCAAMTRSASRQRMDAQHNDASTVTKQRKRSGTHHDDHGRERGTAWSGHAALQRAQQTVWVVAAC